MTHDHDHEHEIVPFAQTNFRGNAQRFGIKTDDRRRHMYLVGKTGMGKTSMLEQLVYHDIVAGHGVAYIDPHGDTAKKMLDFIPKHRINDVVYFNPADLEWPVAFNVLEHVDRNQQHLVSSGLIGIFKKIWADSWGPRLEYVLRNAILALMDYPGSTLLGIMRILVDKEYRRKVIAMVQDPVVKSFWVDEYSRYPDKFQTEAIAPIQNKVGQFLSSPIIRNIVGQVKSTIQIQDIMDNRKILIMNLAKGGIGEDNSALLGAMMVTKLYLAAMQRVRIPENEREDFYLYVDEFQNFATDSFADILSEARKYRLNLVIAHQYIGQLMTETSTRVRDAVYGNVGTIVSFRVGAQDAEFLEPEFQPTFLQEDLVNLPKWVVYLKLMIDGVASEPFSASTLLPLEMQYELTMNTEKVTRGSRERYSVPRSDIEDKIARWTGMTSEGRNNDSSDDEGAAAKDKARDATRDNRSAPSSQHRTSERGPRPNDAQAQRSRPASSRESKRPEPRTVECSKCGSGATVYFTPRPGQRVLCANCMRGEKERQRMAEVEGKQRVSSQERRKDSGRPREERKQEPRSDRRPPDRPIPAPPSPDELEPVVRPPGAEVSLTSMLNKKASDNEETVGKSEKGPPSSSKDQADELSRPRRRRRRKPPGGAPPKKQED
jgi:CxxC-x17-CxxC domain-containing protein